MKIAYLAVSGLIAAGGVAVPAVGQPYSKIGCTAKMSSSSPKQYSKVYVNVHSVAYAKVATTAHYKTKNTSHSAAANSSGNASVLYKISSAKKGYKVVVSVTVGKGSAHGSCSTSFTPK